MTETATREWKDTTKTMGDQIVGLTLLDAQELSDYLKDVHGIEPAAGGGMMMAASAGGEGGEVEEQTAFDVVLASIGEKKIQVIKAVRSITGLGLKEAKDLVEAAPKAVKEGVSQEEADKVKADLEAAGATVEIK